MNDDKKTNSATTVKALGVKPSMLTILTETKSQTEAKSSTTAAQAIKQSEVKPKNETPKIDAPVADSSNETESKDMRLQTRSQKYAAAVYKKVKEVEANTKKGDSFRKKYGGMAHKLPVLVRTAGLAQALAFVAGKGEAGWSRLVEDLNAVVGKTNGKDLLQASLNEDLFSYMHLTRKTMDALVWFKRFAVSVLDVEQGEDDTGDDRDKD